MDWWFSIHLSLRCISHQMIIQQCRKDWHCAMLTGQSIVDIHGHTINITQDKTRQDKTRQDKTRQDKTRQDKTRRTATQDVVYALHLCVCVHSMLFSSLLFCFSPSPCFPVVCLLLSVFLILLFDSCWLLLPLTLVISLLSLV